MGLVNLVFAATATVVGAGQGFVARCAAISLDLEVDIAPANSQRARETHCADINLRNRR